MNRMVAHVDRRYQIHRLTVEPFEDEAHWSAIADPDDLHLQLLARSAGADYVLSQNIHDFPGRRSVSEYSRGVLRGIVWIQPEDLLQGLRRSVGDLPEVDASDGIATE